jgi:signal transduction histidine kinase
MGDKRTVLFPLLLFGILFLLITTTGYFQVSIIKENIENLLRGESEIVYTHIRREIDINLEYLDLLEKSPAIITPNFLNAMVSDEAILEDIYNLFSAAENADAGNIPLSNFAVIDPDGNVVFKKGNFTIPRASLKTLLMKKQDTVLKMPAHKDRALVMGMWVKGRIVFFSIDERELDALRKKFIIRDILEREERRFNVVGIKIYDEKGSPYLTIIDDKEKAFVLSKPLDSRFLPKYRMEVFISKGLADDTVKRTTFSFIIILICLAVSGAISTFVIFVLERKHGKKMEELEKEMALKERLVSLGRLASGMAHEIRNPLNAISLSVQRLKREFSPAAEKKKEYDQFLDIVRSELTRVDKIVEEFLLSTKANIPFSQENLYAIVEEVLMIIREKAASRNVDIRNNINTDIIVESQKDKLKQAFYNIIVNGVEAIQSKGVIELSTERHGSVVDVVIKDTGVGIKKEEKDKIFEYYFTTKDKGIGVGLPISYIIIKDHNGDIKVSSEEGRGATFVITLPLKQPLKEKGGKDG